MKTADFSLPPETTEALRRTDQRCAWHPFTPLEAWCAPSHNPLILTGGRGAWLWDSDGNRYLDGNSSIWTNIHGHAHPKINAALRAQLDRVAHTSFLGFSNPLAIELADQLIAHFPPAQYSRLFFSDNGSTAIEVAIKMSIQFWQICGHPERRRFLAFSNAYHGDTLGAASLGGIALFHERFQDSHFPVRHLTGIEELETLTNEEISQLAGVVIEPLIQGAAGMRVWPPGMFIALRKWCDSHGVLLIADEIMTGFGRTGTMFACEQEGVYPDFLALAKGLTGGYLPLAATLVAPRVAHAFESGPAAETTFFYGHSYTGNALGCAAALASWALFEEEKVLERLQPKISLFHTLLEERLQPLPQISAIRKLGLIAGVDVQPDAEPLRGARVCVAARRFGLLTRPIRDTVILMPPLCVEEAEIHHMIEALRSALLN